MCGPLLLPQEARWARSWGTSGLAGRDFFSGLVIVRARLGSGGIPGKRGGEEEPAQ